LVEVSIASAFTGNQHRSAGLLLAALLIVVTSATLGWLWARRSADAGGGPNSHAG